MSAMIPSFPLSSSSCVSQHPLKLMATTFITTAYPLKTIIYNIYICVYISTVYVYEGVCVCQNLLSPLNVARFYVCARD